jgi:hypothetical protein
MPKKSGGLDERVLFKPSLNLTAFILSEAGRIAEAEGFGWKASASAPSTFEAVLATYEHSQETRERYPVATDGSSTSIYASSEANHAFRFLHDMTHVRLELGFDPDSELYVAVEHLNALRRAGYKVGSLEWHLLHADTIGQVVAGYILGRFVYDQRAFVFDCVLLGLKRAIENEQDRRPLDVLSSNIETNSGVQND